MLENKKHENNFHSLTEKIGSVRTIKKPEGTYTVIYGQHNAPQHEEDLPDNLDGLILETGKDQDWPKEPINAAIAFVYHPQFEKWATKIKDQKIPIILADAAPRGDKIAISIDLLPPLIESAIGITLMGQMVKDFYQKKFNRRDLLKTAAKSVAALWLASPLTSYLSRGSFSKTSVEELSAEFQKISEKIHPESFLIIQIRNAVLAYKEKWLMEKGGLGNEPHLAIALGATHAGIENFIENYDAKELLQFLHTMRFLVQKVFDQKTFYTIAIAEFGKIGINDGWVEKNVYEIPELKKIINEE